MSQQKSPALSIVIVNYRTPGLCIDCLTSLADIEGLDVEIIIVDNDSRDDSVAQISQSITDNNWASVKLVKSASNDGFSAGNNIGISVSRGDLVLLLNSDTIVRPGTIELLVQTMLDNPRAGMVSPRLEWTDGSPQESCFRFHHPANELIRSACSGPVTRLLKRYEVPTPVTDKISYPQWTSFACVLIRRELFDQFGLLDDAFFMYFEDVDFCQRARKAGWTIINNPSAHVVHLRGGSSPVKSQAAKKKRLPRYFYESRSRYYFKYFGRSGLLTANLFWHLGSCIGLLRKLFNPNYQTNICERQWLDIWTNFSDPTAPYIHPDNY